MYYFVYDATGAIHLIAAIISLISGTAILILPKGTALHKKIGYIYVAAMLAVCTSAFRIYRLFGGFGVFHIAALVSTITILGGIIPALLRKPDNWVEYHFSFMYWSVLGLYAAFVSEIATRVPETPFFGMVGLGTGFIMITGGAWFYYKKDEWAKQMGAGDPDSK